MLLSLKTSKLSLSTPLSLHAENLSHTLPSFPPLSRVQCSVYTYDVCICVCAEHRVCVCTNWMYEFVSCVDEVGCMILANTLRFLFYLWYKSDSSQ